MNNRTERARILLCAKFHGWRLHKINDWSYVLKRIDSRCELQTINIYWNRKNSLFIVQTALNHPKKGRNQLNRRYISLEQVFLLLDNPRSHTGKGYRTTKKR